MHQRAGIVVNAANQTGGHFRRNFKLQKPQHLVQKQRRGSAVHIDNIERTKIVVGGVMIDIDHGNTAVKDRGMYFVILGHVGSSGIADNQQIIGGGLYLPDKFFDTGQKSESGRRLIYTGQVHLSALSRQSIIKSQSGPQ